MEKSDKYNFSGFDSVMAPISPAKPEAKSDAQAPVESNKLSALENILAQVAQGVTFGHLDEATGLVGGALDAVTTNKTFSEARKQHTDEARRMLKEAEYENPISSTISNIAGSILVPAGVLGQVSKGASAGQKALTAAKAGAIAGGATQVGTSESSDTGELVREGLTGAAVGAALGPAFEAAGGLVGKGVGAGKEFYENNYMLKRLGDAFEFGQRNPDFSKTEGRKRILGELDETIRDEVVPLVDKALQRTASAGYEEAKKKSAGIRLKDTDFMGMIVPEEGMNLKNFQYSTKGQSAAKKLRDITDELINKSPVDLSPNEMPLAKEGQRLSGMIDVDAVFKYRQKISDIMDSLRGEAIDIDAFKQLSQMKNNLTKVLEEQYQIPIKKLDAQYAKADQFKQRLGIDLSDAGPDAFTAKEQGAVSKLAKQFVKESKDPTSQEAAQIENAYEQLRKSGIVDPAKLDESLGKVRTAAKEARILKDTYGEAGFPGGPKDFITQGGESIRSLLTTGIAHAGKISKPAYDVARNVVNATPEELIMLSNTIKDSGIAKVLKQMATEPLTKRKAMLFTLMQSPAYRDAITDIDKD